MSDNIPRPSQTLLARMNELLARAIMLLPHPEIRTSRLPAPLRNLSVIPDIDFDQHWSDDSESDLDESDHDCNHGNEKRSTSDSDMNEVSDASEDCHELHCEMEHQAGVPLRPDAGALRRLNALRRRRRGEDRTRELHAELASVRAVIRASARYAGVLPLFVHHSHGPGNALDRMDRFLESVHAGRLWPRKRGRKHHQQPRKRRRLQDRKQSGQTSESECSTSQDEDRSPFVQPNYRDRQRTVLASECPKSSHESKSTKPFRSDIATTENSTSSLAFPHGETLGLHMLDSSARKHILRGLNCSFWHSGLSFSLQKDGLLLRMALTQVSSGGVEGLLSGLAPELLSFLCAREKAAALQALLAAVCANHSGSCDIGSLSVPFAGHIVDFHDHDLRFCNLSDVPSARNADFARLQLREWLRIRPFLGLRQLFFLKYLEFAEASVRSPENGCPHLRQFARLFRDLMIELARGSECDLSASAIQYRSARPPFVQEWDAKLGDRISEYASCASCLLNVQLNYILFAVKVDAAAGADAMFRRLLPLAPDCERNALSARWDALQNEKLRAPRQCVLVCSLDRKTGRVEARNTRVALDHFHASPFRPEPVGSTLAGLYCRGARDCSTFV